MGVRDDLWGKEIFRCDKISFLDGDNEGSFEIMNHESFDPVLSG